MKMAFVVTKASDISSSSFVFWDYHQTEVSAAVLGHPYVCPKPGCYKMVFFFFGVVYLCPWLETRFWQQSQCYNLYPLGGMVFCKHHRGSCITMIVGCEHWFGMQLGVMSTACTPTHTDGSKIWVYDIDFSMCGSSAAKDDYVSLV